jgi:putative peptidoglycan lipid II flippase
MIPALLGASVVQISLLINTIFASFLQVGSITWLYYSERLVYFPLGIFGVALATVILPHLSQQYFDKNPLQFSGALDWGLRCNFLIGLPAALTLALFAAPIILTLFGYGRFNAHDVVKTSESLITYALGLQAFMLAKILATGFYSRQDMKTPVKYSLLAILVGYSITVCAGRACIACNPAGGCFCYG